MHGSIMVFLFLGAVRLRPRQLPRAAADRRAGHGVPAAQRARRTGCTCSAGSRCSSGFLTADGAGRLRLVRLRAAVGRHPLARRSAATSGSSASCSRACPACSPRSTSSPPSRRCARPGMTMFRMPIFTWNMLVTSVLVLIAFPVLTAAGADAASPTATSAPTSSTPADGGEPILWQHLFWFFGHPEVYIARAAVLRRGHRGASRCSRGGRCSATRASSLATLGIAALSVGVWAHHMFATGAVVLPFFCGLVDPHRRADRRQVLQLDRHDVGRPPHVPDARCCSRSGSWSRSWSAALTGVILASPPVDFQLHRLVLRRRPLALRAVRRLGVRAVRRHLLLVPEVHRQLLHEGWGQRPLLADVRRLQPDVLRAAHARRSTACPAGSPTTCAADGFTTLNRVSSIGAFLLGASTLPFLWNVWRTLRRGDAGRRRPVGRAHARVGDARRRRRRTTSTGCPASARTDPCGTWTTPTTRSTSDGRRRRRHRDPGRSRARRRRTPATTAPASTSRPASSPSSASFFTFIALVYWFLTYE